MWVSRQAEVNLEIIKSAGATLGLSGFRPEKLPLCPLPDRVWLKLYRLNVVES
jgi:hypothetical protein